MARPVVDLPQPDSPTRPSVSPRFTVKSSPSTARTLPTSRCKMMPSVIGKCIFRPSTRRMVSAPGPLPLVDGAPAAVLCALRIVPVAARSVVGSLAGIRHHRLFNIGPAGRGMGAVHGAQQGPLLQANRHMEAAARVEGTARRHVD